MENNRIVKLVLGMITFVLLVYMVYCYVPFVQNAVDNLLSGYSNQIVESAFEWSME